jgi:hypothetical protein
MKTRTLKIIVFLEVVIILPISTWLTVIILPYLE